MRFVEARCAELAERLVLQQLRSELVPPLGYTPSKQERVYIEQLEIVEAGQVPARQQGFVWYLMESALTNSNGTSDPAVDEPTH
ncbi:MAG: hypothetical protein RMJ88_11940 [Thermogemmata sp.]|nr:hypothetical protein [Thermogemmata sp.]